MLYFVEVETKPAFHNAESQLFYSGQCQLSDA